MTPFEKFHVNRLCERGCAICKMPPCWHHFIHKINGGRLTKIHLFGIPLCPDHHTDGDDAVHKVADENKWCADHNIKKEDWIGEASYSLLLWVTK
jgi:hypothetical protein